MKNFLKQFIWCLLFVLVFAPSAAMAAHVAGHVDTVPATGGPPSLFDCDGSRLAIGLQNVIQGVYVPVSDLAVTRNTGNTVRDLNALVYKECVLDVIARQQADAALTNYTGSILERANTGRGGAPKFVSNPKKELELRDAETTFEFIKDYNLQNLCAPFKNDVKLAVARRYMANKNEPNNAFRCAMGLAPADHEAFLRGDTARGGSAGLWNLFSNPNNTPWGAALSAQLSANQRRLEKNQSLLLQWNWGNGFYPEEEVRKSPRNTGEDELTRYSVTPAYIVARITEQAASSGFRRLENTDEIGEVTAATFAGMTNQIMTTPAGLTGLSQSTAGGGISFLEELANLTLSQLRDTVTNTAIARVRSAIATEQAYAAAKTQTKTALQNAAIQIRSAEDACWAKVVPAVQAAAAGTTCPPAAPLSPPCTPVPPTPLNIATSSQRITGGTAALQIASGVSILNGTPFTIQAPQTSLIESSSISITARAATTTASVQNISLVISGSPTALAPGGSVSLGTQSTPLFSAGIFTIDLRAGQRLPVGNLGVALNPLSPFVTAAVTLIVEAARQFADLIVAQEITPLVTQTDQDIAASANGVALLQAIEVELGQRDSPDVQRAALERLESLLASNAVHSQLDAQNAELQRSEVTGASQTLVTDTQTSWTTGGNWCNVDNPNVIQEWLNRWRI